MHTGHRPQPMWLHSRQWLTTASHLAFTANLQRPRAGKESIATHLMACGCGRFEPPTFLIIDADAKR